MRGLSFPLLGSMEASPLFWSFSILSQAYDSHWLCLDCEDLTWRIISSVTVHWGLCWSDRFDFSLLDFLFVILGIIFKLTVLKNSCYSRPIAKGVWQLGILEPVNASECLFDDRRLTTGYRSLISWKNENMHGVVQSRVEALFRAISLAFCKLLGLYNLLINSRMAVSLLTKLHCYNIMAIRISSNQVYHEHAKRHHHEHA